MKWATIVAAVACTTIAVVTASESPAGADCGLPQPPVVFVGRAEARAGTAITFRVEEVPIPPTEPDHLAPGEAAVVDLGDDAGLLEVGRIYQVATDGPRQGWSSYVVAPTRQLGNPDGPCGGGFTTMADGTPIIEEGWYTRVDFALVAAVALGSMVALIVVVETTKAVRRRRIEHR